ncbi:MAG: FHA domain-containing protein [Pyrinomonadaceae bacterium]
MLSKETGTFSVEFAGSDEPVKKFYKEGIFIGRLGTCEIVLDHKSVSRIHAAINFRDKKYVLVNLTSSNILTLNGRLLGPEKDDVLAGGDTIQIGPFTIHASIDGGSLSLEIEQVRLAEASGQVAAPAKPPPGMPDAGDVLKVFWEKRSRQKEDWGTRLRPTEKPKPGKAMYNWRPTRDLKRTWRFGLFVWAFLLVGAIGTFAYFRYPQAYSPEPLSMAHAKEIPNSTIAVRENANACTTCHMPNEPLENSCVTCHQAETFHATNTKAHEEAGITCTACHKEHRGAGFDMVATAIQSCAECHNDANKQTYNGKTVATAHEGSYGYPAENGVWKWKGVYREVADAIPEINSSATGDKDEQAKLSRHFHTVHTARLKTPEGLKGDSRGLVSCSTCHNSFDPVDRETPRATCAVCHTTTADAAGRDKRFGVSTANCISCHTQHPYGSDRWSEFLTADAAKRRQDAIAAKIRQLKGQ